MMDNYGCRMMIDPLDAFLFSMQNHKIMGKFGRENCKL
jgi:hypothetical protein